MPVYPTSALAVFTTADLSSSSLAANEVIGKSEASKKQIATMTTLKLLNLLFIKKIPHMVCKHRILNIIIYIIFKMSI